jgi:hypothetical protein
MIVIWLQGIWLPLHGCSFTDTPLWAGIYMLPLTAGFLIAVAILGIATGMFASPNSSSIMGSVPADARGVASGMRATFQNSGTALSISVFFTLIIAGLADNLPTTLYAGLRHAGAPAAAAVMSVIAAGASFMRGPASPVPPVPTTEEVPV